MANFFRDDGVEDKTSQYISTYIGTWPGSGKAGGDPYICLAYESPAPSHPGKDGVRQSLSICLYDHHGFVSMVLIEHNCYLPRNSS